MITVTRLQGEQFFLNPDLIETLEENGPCTVVTLVDGKKLNVQERPKDIVGAVTVWRASILAVTAQISQPDPADRV